MTDPETPLNNAQHSGLFVKMKPFLSFDDQLSLLKKRNLIIRSEEDAKHILKTENYYRLSGYFKLFVKCGTDVFIDGFSFKQLLKIYYFDFELRLLLDRFLAIAEINARTRIAYNLARVSSPDSYLDVRNFSSAGFHASFINEINKERKRSSRNPIVSHFAGQDIPIWVLVEIMTFGVISKMYANLTKAFQNAICASPDYAKTYVRGRYENYLKIACDLRNICAHHGRLYGKRFPHNISLSKKDADLFKKYGFSTPSGSSSTAFELVFATTKLLENNDVKNKLVKLLKRLFHKYKRYISLDSIGFNNNWDLVLKECE